MEHKYEQEKLDRDRETRFNRDIQIHEIELMDQIARIKNIMVSVQILLSNFTFSYIDYVDRTGSLL